MTSSSEKRRIVIIVENLPVPLDRRVWQEARALKAAGWTVSVICPTSEKFPQLEELLEGISIYRHPLPLEARGTLGFIAEYLMALFHETRLLLRVAGREGFDIIQVCNPPDILFLVALPWKLFGKKMVFDHHDVCPELFEAKFGHRPLFQFLLRTCEKLTFMTADFVISANESYRQLAVSRGGKDPAKTQAVYSVPDRERFQRRPPNQALRRGRQIVIGYIGIIGDQDGVDSLVSMAAELIAMGFDDFQIVVVGDGPALNHCVQEAKRLKVEDHITFTGYLNGETMLETLSTFDVAVVPDPPNPYNDKISMNKVFEYSMLGCAIVSHPLSETRQLLGDAALYTKRQDARGLAEAVLPLCRDPVLRAERAKIAADWAAERFDWVKEADKYVRAIGSLRP